MRRTTEFFLMLVALLLAACGGSTASAFVPAGIAQGQPTFLYVFTDN